MLPFFATTCNYLLKKYDLSNQWTAKPRIGQLYFPGTNIHPYFPTPFFKDHDYVTIENKKRPEKSLRWSPNCQDYLTIDFVSLSK